ncbi:MAG: DNA topology modulation protein [Proteobacteria bacterium]|nr:DNA topology modulation protein [Pseudomonadota bacterium]
MLFGRPGSGKSTFAFKLHKMTKIPLHHLDKHFYEANWIERNYEEFLALQKKIVDQESWIIDGNSLKSLEMRYSRAQMTIYFNFPLRQCYWRVFKRLFDKNPQIDDRAEGCRETIKIRLLQYGWHFPKRIAPSLEVLRKTYPRVTFIEVKSQKDLKMLEKEFLK